jgi:hypothetical protein
MEPSSSPARTLSSQRISASVTACRYSVCEAYATRQTASAEGTLEVPASTRSDSSHRSQPAGALLAITAGRDRGIVDELASRHASPEHLIDLRNHPIREPHHNTLRTRNVAITARTRGPFTGHVPAVLAAPAIGTMTFRKATVQRDRLSETECLSEAWRRLPDRSLGLGRRARAPTIAPYAIRTMGRSGCRFRSMRLEAPRF